MADRNRDDQQNSGPYGYRHRYGGGYQEDHNRGGRSNTGAAYSSNEEEGYTQDMGREHSDRKGSRNPGMTGGSHRGKGPKNYERSQDRMREDVCERLTDDAMIDASNMEVRVENNEVVLSGTVRNREEKRRAEDLAEAVAGVRNVENRLRVEPSSGSDTSYYREYDEQGRVRSGR